MTYFLNPAYRRLDSYSSKNQQNTSCPGIGVFEECMDQNMTDTLSPEDFFLTQVPSGGSLRQLLWEGLINLPNPWWLCFSVSQD